MNKQNQFKTALGIILALFFSLSGIRLLSVSNKAQPSSATTASTAVVIPSVNGPVKKIPSVPLTDGITIPSNVLNVWPQEVINYLNSLPSKILNSIPPRPPLFEVEELAMLRVPLGNSMTSTDVDLARATAESAVEFLNLNRDQPLRLYRNQEGVFLFCVGVLERFAGGHEVVSELPAWWDILAHNDRTVFQEPTTGAFGLYIQLDPDLVIDMVNDGRLPNEALPLAYSLRSLRTVPVQKLSLTIFERVPPQILRDLADDNLIPGGVNNLPGQRQVVRDEQPFVQRRGLLYKITTKVVSGLNSSVQFLWNWKFTFSGIGLSVMGAHMAHLYERIAILEAIITRANLIAVQHEANAGAVRDGAHPLGRAPRPVNR